MSSSSPSLQSSAVSAIHAITSNYLALGTMVALTTSPSCLTMCHSLTTMATQVGIMATPPTMAATQVDTMANPPTTVATPATTDQCLLV